MRRQKVSERSLYKGETQPGGRRKEGGPSLWKTEEKGEEPLWKKENGWGGGGVAFFGQKRGGKGFFDGRWGEKAPLGWRREWGRVYVTRKGFSAGRKQVKRMIGVGERGVVVHPSGDGGEGTHSYRFEIFEL